MSNNEADTCRMFVVPKLQAAGWDNDPHSIAEQRTVTDGRVVPVGKGFIRKPPKRVDYLLRHSRDSPIAVVEAKANYKSAADGVQQARGYAEMPGLKFAYATNGYQKSLLGQGNFETGRATQHRPVAVPSPPSRQKKRTIVEYALRDARKPIGVATYAITRTLPKKLQGSCRRQKSFRACCGSCECLRRLFGSGHALQALTDACCFTCFRTLRINCSGSTP